MLGIIGKAPKLFLAAILWLVVLFVVSACSIAAQRIGPELSGAVVTYCVGVPQLEREAIRASVNSQIAPHSVSINCAGDE